MLDNDITGHITSSKFVISTRNQGTMNDNFVVNSSGNVGIGTTSPTTLLQVSDQNAEGPTFKIDGLSPSILLQDYSGVSNTVDNFERLSIDFTKEGIRTFLLSARFLFQSLDRVQFYDIRGNLIGDTNILDLDQSVFSRSDFIIEETIDGKSITPEIQERLEEEEKDNELK